MKLHDLKPAPGSRKAKRRVGRGIAAGQGKTAGRGTKGQKARAGGKIPAWFEGGQTPLHQRIPKLRGFKNPFKIEYEVVNIGDIARLVELGELESGDMPGTKASKKGAAPITVNQEILRAAGLVRRLDRPMKVLGGGDLSTALFVVADAFSASARSKIEGAGGTVSVLEVPEHEAPGARRDRRGPAGETHRRALPKLPMRRQAEAPADAAPAEAPADEAPVEAAAKPARAKRGTATAACRRRGADASRRAAAAEAARRGRRRRTGRARGRDGAGEAREAARQPQAQDPEARRGRVADRVRVTAQRLPRAGHPAPDPVRPRDPGRLPRARPGAPAGHRPRGAGGVLPEQRRVRDHRPVRRRRPVGDVDRRPGDEPVHQRLDHHAADDGRDPVAPGAEQGRRVRPAAAEPVHPLPDRADGPPPGVRHPVGARRPGRDHRRLRPRQRPVVGPDDHAGRRVRSC